MNRYKYVLLVLLISGLGYSFYPPSKEVKLLEKCDFNAGNWVIIKGYHGDSIQYVLTESEIQNELKAHWVLSKTSKNFATTGGYIVEIYQNGKREMYMDIINDGEISRKSPGILYNSVYESLSYKNLEWLDYPADKWKKVKAIEKEFKSLSEKTAYLEALSVSIKTELTIVSEIDKPNEFYVYLVYEIE